MSKTIIGVKRSGLALAGAAIAALALAGTAVAAPRHDLQNTAEDLVDAGATGYLVRVHDGQNILTATTGVANRDTRRRVKNKDHYQAGSQTKTFVAALVLQLVAQGELRLDDPVEQHLPGVVPNGANITVRMLLQHTSGLPDFDTAPDFQELFTSDPTRPISTPELLDIAFALDVDFEPGDGWNYSNTNYLVVGELLRAVTGEPVADLLHQRLLRPLRLNDSYLSDHLVTDTGVDYLRGYVADVEDGAFTEYTDTTDWTLSWAGAAGALVTTARDLTSFYRMLLSGQVLAAPELAEMKKTVLLSDEPGAKVGYGLGIFFAETPCGTGWGHNGGTPGHLSTTMVSPDGLRSFTDVGNTAIGFAADLADPASQALVKASDRAFYAGVCAMFGQKLPKNVSALRAPGTILARPAGHRGITSQGDR